MWMQDGCRVYVDSYMASNGSCFMVTWAIFKNHLLEGRPRTKPRDHGTPNVHNHWFTLFYHAWGLSWVEIHWNSIWLRARSHMTAHSTWGSVTTVHDVGGVLGRPLHTFFWAPTISWSRLLARVWSGPVDLELSDDLMEIDEAQLCKLGARSLLQDVTMEREVTINWTMPLKVDGCLWSTQICLLRDVVSLQQASRRLFYLKKLRMRMWLPMQSHDIR